MANVIASGVVDHGFEPPRVKTKTNKQKHKIGYCCFSASHAAVKEKSKTEWGYYVRVERHVYPGTGFRALTLCALTNKKDNKDHVKEHKAHLIM